MKNFRIRVFKCSEGYVIKFSKHPFLFPIWHTVKYWFEEGLDKDTAEFRERIFLFEQDAIDASTQFKAYTDIIKYNRLIIDDKNEYYRLKETHNHIKK